MVLLMRNHQIATLFKDFEFFYQKKLNFDFYGHFHEILFSRIFENGASPDRQIGLKICMGDLWVII